MTLTLLYLDLDRDRTGSLDYEEFGQILREVGCMTLAPELSAKVMATYDADGNGEIDYHEFVGHVLGSVDVAGHSSFEHKVVASSTLS